MFNVIKNIVFMYLLLLFLLFLYNRLPTTSDIVELIALVDAALHHTMVSYHSDVDSLNTYLTNPNITIVTEERIFLHRQIGILLEKIRILAIIFWCACSMFFITLLTYNHLFVVFCTNFYT